MRSPLNAIRVLGVLALATVPGGLAPTTAVIAQDDWISRDCDKYGASAVPRITPGSVSPYVLEKLRQKDAPRIQAARQECERRKRQQKEAAAEQARQEAAERERERQAREQAAELQRQAQERAAELERQAQERERQRQAYEALPAQEKATLEAAETARRESQNAAAALRQECYLQQAQWFDAMIARCNQLHAECIDLAQSVCPQYAYGANKNTPDWASYRERIIVRRTEECTKLPRIR